MVKKIIKVLTDKVGIFLIIDQLKSDLHVDLKDLSFPYENKPKINIKMTQLVIDPSHSDLGFKIRHLMVSNVKGTLTNYSGGMNYTAEDMSDAQVRFEAEVNSISTGNADRDAHLNAEDFFNTERFPKMYFESTIVSVENGKMKGEMTIKDTTKEIELDIEYNGKSVDPWGNTKHGFEITGVINRSDFDLTWNAPLETGGVLLSDEVKLTLDVQMMEMAEQTEEQIEEQAA